MAKPPDETVDIEKVIGIEEPSRNNRLRLTLLGAAIFGVLLVIGWHFLGAPKNGATQFQTERAINGPITITVTATGELKPLNQVDVGTEVSGTIKTVAVDYNDNVQAGDVLAVLDTTKLNAQVLQSEAALQSARADLMQAEAALAEAENNFGRLKRARELSGGRVPSLYDIDAADAALKKAAASKAMARAKIAQAKASLDAYTSDQDKAVIRAPISGIVLMRDVEPGQTVAASLQTPVLFTMAEDLTAMELEVGVDEADVGQVKVGQPAVFTVDAYPDKTFPAEITQVRYASTTENSVVTYKTLLSVKNPDLLLRPGMTATADITVKQINNALLIPNAALRFTPQTTGKKQKSSGRGLVGSLFPRPGRHRDPPTPVDAGPRKTVWILTAGNMPKPVPVTIGSTDGSKTQVLTGDIEPGMALITDQATMEK